jgi:L,D-transpeptidase ErfK/SrfK
MAGIDRRKKTYAMMIALMLNLTLGFGVSAIPALQARAEQIEASKLVINIPSRTLWVYVGNNIVRYFPVGLGKPGFMTPLGKYSITSKVIDPGWEHPYVGKGKIRIAPGAGNPLGTRWMGFHYYKGGEYGFHGTDRPSSVGQFSSHGCVRMKIKDAEALFEMVEVGTPVEVIYETVLIRPKGNELRVLVYPDVFKRGMPSAEKVISNIRAQYPTAKVEPDKIRAALSRPTQQPVVVGLLQDTKPDTQHAEALEPLHKVPLPQ